MDFYGNLEKKHLKSIQATFHRLGAAKLTAKPSKCKLGYSKIECQLDFALISTSLTRLQNLMRNLCRIWRKLLIECQGIGVIHKWICVRDIGS